MLEDVLGDRRFAPKWMFNQTRGVMIDAIVSENFEEYLDKVADNRWNEFFEQYVFSHKLDYVLKLENPLEIRHFMKNNIHADFELRHENMSESKKLVWSENNLNKFRKIVSKICERLGYNFD